MPLILQSLCSSGLIFITCFAVAFTDKLCERNRCKTCYLTLCLSPVAILPCEINEYTFWTLQQSFFQSKFVLSSLSRENKSLNIRSYVNLFEMSDLHARSMLWVVDASINALITQTVTRSLPWGITDKRPRDKRPPDKRPLKMPTPDIRPLRQKTTRTKDHHCRNFVVYIDN